MNIHISTIYGSVIIHSVEHVENNKLMLQYVIEASRLQRLTIYKTGSQHMGYDFEGRDK